MKFTKSKRWKDFLVFMNLQDLDSIPPPQILPKDQINFSDYVAYKTIFHELVDNLALIENDETACHCFMEGYEEAIAILEFLINEELTERFNEDVTKFHEELETFLKNQGK